MEGHGKRTGNVHPRAVAEDSSTLSLISALEGVSDQRHAPAALPLGKTRYPLYRRLGGPQVRSGRGRKISPATGIRSPDFPASSESLYRLRYPGPISLLGGGAGSILGRINVGFMVDKVSL